MSLTVREVMGLGWLDKTRAKITDYVKNKRNFQQQNASALKSRLYFEYGFALQRT